MFEDFVVATTRTQQLDRNNPTTTNTNNAQRTLPSSNFFTTNHTLHYITFTMCTHANTTKSAKSARTAETATTADPVDMADPICSCTKCYCRIIVPIPGSLCEYCKDLHN
ncbi:hypothetical protein CEP51_004710 [Fusarium floridanum]|uniref:Uncharacterized protein n=1 Tax=Fusarium floridanum TaxID=1325733 RepID=A0A428S002_9HYPO|nr:hypothetical protein CEP51_004710 [Fusarium floridanum]